MAPRRRGLTVLDGQRIAIVHLSAIGDVVHALPFVASLRAAAPTAVIEWVVQPVPAAIAGRHPAVDRIRVLDRRRGWRGFRDFRRALRGERFDLVLDLQTSGKASLATLILDAPRKIGFDRPRARELNWLATNERIPARSHQHVLEQVMEFADWLGIPRRYEWALPLDAAETAARDAFRAAAGRPIAALAVSASDPRKDWPVARWARLAEALSRDWGYAVALAGGDHPRERARAEAIVAQARVPVLDARGGDVRRLLWILDAAALVVAPDTGPYHLAVGLGVPSVGLFGATDPARWGPGPRFAELVVDAYHAPGEAWHPPRPRRRPGRMEAIEVERAREAVALARARYPRAAPPSDGVAPRA